MSIANADTLREVLLSWYAINKRDLPWRQEIDPYSIWVAEIMAQQTRMLVVIPYYRRFMQRFKTLRKLSKASEDQVYAVWSGLGYYRRARDLLATAKLLAHQYRGEFPSQAAELATLPGIGKYTAAAIASIAFGEPIAVFDGNVRRLLRRLTGLLGSPSGKVDAQLTAFANQILDRHRPGEFNQAMMELGALICLPKSPRCPLCPLNSVCEANQRGIVEQLPIRNPRAAPRRLHGYLLLVKNVRGELWFTRGLPKPLPSNRQWQLPVVLDTQHLFTHLKRRGERHKPQVRHAITNNQLNLELLELEDPAVVNRLHGQGVWLAPRALNNRPLSALCLKGLRAGGCV